jgi:hypothetical protein
MLGRGGVVALVGTVDAVDGFFVDEVPAQYPPKAVAMIATDVSPLHHRIHITN